MNARQPRIQRKITDNFRGRSFASSMASQALSGTPSAPRAPCRPRSVMRQRPGAFAQRAERRMAGISFRLDGQRALVTGASKGIGREAAIALAEAGAEVVAAARSAAELAALVAELN